MNYFKKYLKYKNKYLSFRQFGGSSASKPNLFQALDELMEMKDEQPKKTKIEEIICLITPDSAKSKNVGGMTPIQYLSIFYFQFKHPDIYKIVDALLKAYPASAMEIAGSDGTIPLHYFSQNLASIEIISILLHIYPEGAKIKNNKGKLPIHYAVRENASIDVVNAIIEAFPQGLCEKTAKGKSALHCALEKKASFDIVKTLVEKSPRCISIIDNDDNTVIHYAVIDNASINIVKILLEKYPLCAYERNSKGNLPLH